MLCKIFVIRPENRPVDIAHQRKVPVLRKGLDSLWHSPYEIVFSEQFAITVMEQANHLPVTFL